MVTRVARFDGWNVLQLRHSLLICCYGPLLSQRREEASGSREVVRIVTDGGPGGRGGRWSRQQVRAAKHDQLHGAHHQPLSQYSFTNTLHHLH